MDSARALRFDHHAVGAHRIGIIPVEVFQIAEFNATNSYVLAAGVSKSNKLRIDGTIDGGIAKINRTGTGT